MTVSPSDLTKWFQSIAAGPQSPCPHGGSNESRTGNEQVSVFFLATDEPGRTVCGSCLGASIASHGPSCDHCTAAAPLYPWSLTVGTVVVVALICDDCRGDSFKAVLAQVYR